MILRNKRTTFVLIVMVLALFAVSFNVIAQQIAQSQLDAEEKSLEDQKKWTEDIDKKLDTTIKVLTVIKEELEAEEKKQEKIISETPPTTKEEEQKELVRSTASWLTRLKKMWQEARKAAAPEDEKAQVEAQIRKEDAQQAIDTKEISEKIGTAISLMAAIKEELDKESGLDKESK